MFIFPINITVLYRIVLRAKLFSFTLNFQISSELNVFMFWTKIFVFMFFGKMSPKG